MSVFEVKSDVPQKLAGKTAYIDTISLIPHFEILIYAIFINLTDNCHVRDPILWRGTCIIMQTFSNKPSYAPLFILQLAYPPSPV
jgi:hypothetical protein